MSNSACWTPLHAQLHRTLRVRQLLPSQQRLLVAVSGGQDSMSLIKLLLDLQSKWGWDLAIAHCDHRWRSDSGANADYIEQLARSWQLSFYRQTAQQIPKSEADARRWRYQVLSELALTHHYAYVVTGHTKSDRAETLLYNLIRGSGADGLQALTWKRPLDPQTDINNNTNNNNDTNNNDTNNNDTNNNIWLVRPLLEILRSQTGQFCQDQQLKIWSDSTNEDLNYARNRIRGELIPYLQTHFNPQAEQALAQTAELLQAEVDYLEQASEQLYQQAIAFEPNSTNLKINRLILRQAPLALQRRVMRRWLQEILPTSPSFEMIEKLTALISAPNRSQTDPFPGGAIARVDGEWIYTF
ncbi:tRNA lysidine(34) synthetase TilS [Capilliphycus salinus ALCB114379]|uniref:tRNA lysidine(34) synthetase TilS n=1 Tax=Capilliphycus salinus TaxID=2768948 RepID=UPI0039A6427A